MQGCVPPNAASARLVLDSSAGARPFLHCTPGRRDPPREQAQNSMHLKTDCLSAGSRCALTAQRRWRAPGRARTAACAGRQPRPAVRRRRPAARAQAAAAAAQAAAPPDPGSDASAPRRLPHGPPDSVKLFRGCCCSSSSIARPRQCCQRALSLAALAAPLPTSGAVDYHARPLT